MFFNADISAQQTIAPSIKWKIAAELPPEKGKDVSIGVAGPLTGVHNDVLIVAGGANFPDGLPWNGGKKKYQDEIFVVQQKRKGKFQWLDTKAFNLPVATAYGANVIQNEELCIWAAKMKTRFPKLLFYCNGTNNQKKLRLEIYPIYLFRLQMLRRL